MDESMETRISRLVWEVFDREEREEAELRLSEVEKQYLEAHYHALCTEMDAEKQSRKRWYIVHIERERIVQ